MSKINGTNFLVYADSVAIASSKSCTINYNANMIDVTTKDSAGAKEVLPGLTDWSIDVDGLHDPSGQFSLEDIYDAIYQSLELTVKFATTESGALYFEGQAYVNKMTLAAPMEDATTLSMSFSGTGALNKHNVGGS